jgi:hypothetical protein
MFYALILDANGNGIGSNKYYQNQEPSYPSNEFPCTEAQAKNPTAYQVVNGKIVESLTAAQTAQIALLQSAFGQAEQAPISLTLASGITTSFGMTPHDWTKIVGLYAKYVAKGDAVPSGYSLPDANMVLRVVTATDIDNLFEAGKTQIDGAVAKLSSLVGQVQAATTVSAVQAIVW